MASAGLPVAAEVCMVHGVGWASLSDVTSLWILLYHDQPTVLLGSSSKGFHAGLFSSSQLGDYMAPHRYFFFGAP